MPSVSVHVVARVQDAEGCFRQLGVVGIVTLGTDAHQLRNGSWEAPVGPEVEVSYAVLHEDRSPDYRHLKPHARNDLMRKLGTEIWEQADSVDQSDVCEKMIDVATEYHREQVRKMRR